MIGKSRLGGRKLNVRFDEGELEIEHSHYASSLLYRFPILLPAHSMRTELVKGVHIYARPLTI